MCKTMQGFGLGFGAVDTEESFLVTILSLFKSLSFTLTLPPLVTLVTFLVSAHDWSQILAFRQTCKHRCSSVQFAWSGVKTSSVVGSSQLLPAENVILWGFYEFFGRLRGLLLFRGRALKPTASKVRKQIVTCQGQIQLEFAYEEAPGERIALVCQERIH